MPYCLANAGMAEADAGNNKKPASPISRLAAIPRILILSPLEVRSVPDIILSFISFMASLSSGYPVTDDELQAGAAIVIIDTQAVYGMDLLRQHFVVAEQDRLNQFAL